MNTQNSRRRALLVSATAVAVMAQFSNAAAQTARSGGNWLDMVKVHHLLVAKTLDAVVAADTRTFLARDNLIRTLSYQLTAHSVAEENVLYPAMARAGMVAESDHLYLDQAHAKVMNAGVELAAARDRPGTEWLKTAVMLRTAILKHAKEDEEGRLYPQLQQLLTADENYLLSTLYQREFATVRPSSAVV
jgi:hypothetical protein